MKNDKLIKARKTAGFTQETLAEAAGVTQAMISKYESGLFNPSFEVAHKISSLLGVSMDIFIFEKVAS